MTRILAAGVDGEALTGGNGVGRLEVGNGSGNIRSEVWGLRDLVVSRNKERYGAHGTYQEAWDISIMSM